MTNMKIINLLTDRIVNKYRAILSLRYVSYKGVKIDLTKCTSKMKHKCKLDHRKGIERMIDLDHLVMYY